MLERVIYQVLAAGRETINEDHNFLSTFFSEEGNGLSDLEIEQIQKFWNGTEAIDPDGTKQTGVSIIHQFPRDSTKFPCWSIVLLGEQETTQVLGDEAGTIGDNGEDTLTSFWNKSYAIFTYAPHPLICLYYYELSRFFMTRGRPFLKSAAGGSNLSTKFSGGDMAPDARYVPANMFVRRFQVELVREEQVLGDPQLRGTNIRGMFLDDVEGVTANISTYIPGDDE